MSAPLADVGWELRRAGEALEALASRAGLAPRDVAPPALSESLAQRIVWDGPHAADDWIEEAAAWFGIEAEAVNASWNDVSHLLVSASPALVLVPAAGGARAFWVALAGRAGTRSVRVLAPDLVVRSVAVQDLRDALCAAVEAPALAQARVLLDTARVPAARRAKAEGALLRERLGASRVGGCWLLRVDPGAALPSQFRRAGMHRRVARMIAAQVALYAVSGFGWYVLGRGALEGSLDRAWLVGWALALASAIPLQLVASWHGGFVALEAGAIFKQRLLAGALRLDPETVRHQGAGGLLGRVIESAAVEANALSGATLSIAALPAVLLSLALLAAGPGGIFHVGAYVLFVVVGMFTGLRYGRRRLAWTLARVAMTNDLVERMVGHRTRIAQEAPERWHDGEDRALERYAEASAALDAGQVTLTVLLGRLWILVGVSLLAPSILDEGTAPATLAVGVGAVLFAGAALRAVTSGFVSLVAAGIAWREVGPLFAAASRRDPPGASGAGQITLPRATVQGTTLLEASDIVFRHAGRAEAALQGVSLKICVGDRLLLEGPSGGGKSTLGAVLAGLRSPSSGLLLLHGLDVQSVGALAWRRRVVSAPQFHENHVLTETLAFNLLFGRAWPPSPDDLVEAETVCRELQLGPMLDRMPSGMQQMVGDSGWRLSHGERSRIFIARALLQGADVVVLDESFAALDPETLMRALECAQKRAPALVVIAHP